MRGLLNAGMLNVIKRDYELLVRGPDGVDVGVHWLEEAGSGDDYGRYETETQMYEVVRAHVQPVSNHNVSVRAVQRQLAGEIGTGDHVFYFLPDVDLNRREIWFDVTGVGEFVPELKNNPTEAHPHTPLIPSGRVMIQEVYCRPIR